MSERAPLVVQADRTVLLEVQHPRYEEARDRLARFAELEKSPEHVHFYRVHPVTIWNAAALGVPVDEICQFLVDGARYPVAPALLDEIRTWHARFGLLRLVRDGDASRLWLQSDGRAVLDELAATPAGGALLENGRSPERVDGAWALGVPAGQRGALKQVLTRLGYPVEDRAGYAVGAPLAFALRNRAAAGEPFRLRPYQEEAAAAFWAGGSDRGGCGVVVLPCGAGKTVVGIRVLHLLQTHALVLTTNTVAVRQWRRELLEKTTLTADEIGEYTGDAKVIRPVTIATYQILTHRRRRTAEFSHFGLFDRGAWGAIVYDEVHLLPAPVFRATAAIQTCRRLGLTATLVREDGKEEEVFSLIGPKRYDRPWRELERRGYLARARCIEVRVPLSTGQRLDYVAAGAREQFRLASVNERKVDVVVRLLRRHADGRVLLIGQYLEQLRGLARALGLPLISGATPTVERERLYGAFRRGELKRLLVSKVGNFAVDLPDANVAIQVSGTFGSRQEEAQRLGRILRPKADHGEAVFYALVTEASREAEFAAKRQLFLTEQGYGYEIIAAHAVGGGGKG